MKMTLSKLSENTEEKYGLKLIAGMDGLDHIVRWVHIIEDMEVPEFLHGNELVFTTGIARHQVNWLLHFVQSLKENNAAGIVINLGPYIESVPTQVVVYCEQNDFPLYTIPWKTRIIDVTYEFCRKIIQNEGVEQSMAEAFKNLILNPQATEQYKLTIEHSGFLQDSKYRLILMSVRQDSRNVTERFLIENETALSKVFEQNQMQKAMFLWKEKIVLVYQNLEGANLAELIQGAKLLCKESGAVCSIGISKENESYYLMNEMYEQAEAACIISEVQKVTGLKYENLGIYKILLDVRNKNLLHEYYDEIIGPLESYDAEHQSELCEVLKMYCDTNGGISVMAEAYGVHRNTINYKINKIKKILKKELNHVDVMYIMLCFKIKELID